MSDERPSNKSRRSRKCIKNATKKLIVELKPTSSLTVTTIAAEAKINRATFYYHYDNLELVFIDILQELIDCAYNVVNQYGDKLTPEIFSNALIAWVEENLAYCQAFFKRYPLFTYRDCRRRVSYGMFKVIADHFKLEMDPPLHLSLFISGLVSQVIDDIAASENSDDLGVARDKIGYAFQLLWERLGGKA